MSKPIFLASLCLGLQATSAVAIDLSMKSTLTETLEVNDNYFLAPTPKKMIYRPMSTVAVDAVGKTPTMLYTMSGDFGYYKYLGPGAEHLATTDGTQKGVRFGVEQSGKVKGDKTFLNASWRQYDAAPAQLADTGVATITGQVTTSTLSGGFIRQLGLRDTLSWTTTGMSSEFTNSNSTPYVNLDNTGTWKHRLNPNNDIITLADYSWTVRDNAAKSETKYFRLMTGVDSRLTKRLSLTANVGAGIINSSQNNAAAAPVVNPIPVFGGSGSGTVTGLLWDVMLAYRLQSTTKLSLTAAQNVAPDIDGRLSLRKSVGVTLDHDINSRSSLQFSGSFTNYTSIVNTYDFFTATAAYSYKIAKEWRSTLSYSYRQRNTDTNSVNSNSVMLVLIHDATILPP